MTDVPTRSDRKRQIWVTATFLVAVVGVLVGVGVLGTRVAESPGGDLAADATLVAPAQPAFSIWSVIYLLLSAYVVYQWLPAQASDPRHRRIGWLAGTSLLLNAAWLLVAQQGWIWVSVGIIVVLAAVLAVLVFRLQVTPSFGIAEGVCVDIAFGLYLGWVLAASGANLAAALAASGAEPGRWTAISLIALVALVGAALLRLFSGRLSIAAALAWGLFWIAYGRLAAQPADAAVGMVAGACAVAVLAVAWGSQGRRQRIEDSVAV